MMPIDADAAARWLATGLFTGSVQGAIWVALLWAACRQLPRMPASIQVALWWLAALKLLLALAPVPAIPLPVLPASQAAAAPLAMSPATAGTAFAAEASRGSGWLTVIVGIWIAGVVIQAIRLMLAYRDLRGIVRRSRPPAEDAGPVVAACAAVVGLTRLPLLYTSDEVHAPMVAGIIRPVVLLPGDQRLTSDDLRMSICHELMHVRRRDLALGWVPALAERLFFFHPLARLAAREYVTAREAACDAAVVRALGVSPDDYGGLLLRLGIARSEPALAAGGASFSKSSLRRRLDMLQHSPLTLVSRRVLWALVAVAALTLVPVRLAAKSPSTLVQADVPQAVAPAARAQEATPPASPQTSPRETVPAPPARPGAIEPRAAEALREEYDRAQRDFERVLREVEASGQQPREETAATMELMRAQLAALEAQFRNREWDAYIRETQDSLRALAEETQSRAREVEREYRDRLQAAEQTSEESRRAGEAQAIARAIEERARAAEQTIEERRRAADQARAMEERALADRTVREGGQALTAQLETLRRQQQEMLRHMETISEQQKVLAEEQRRIAAETERLRDALKR